MTNLAGPYEDATLAKLASARRHIQDMECRSNEVMLDLLEVLPDDTLLTAREVAYAVANPTPCTQTVYTLWRSGKLTGEKWYSRTLFRADDVRRYLTTRRRNPIEFVPQA